MPDTHLLAIEIGNTNTKIAQFQGPELLQSDFLPSAAEYAQKICHIAELWHQEQPVTRVIISSVVPALGDLMVTLIDACLSIHPVMVADIKTRLLPLRVDRPETVGEDRIVNCYAALHLFGAPAIVVSLGTATTFEVLSTTGEYLGGSIAPGIKISLDALTQRTALLPPAILKKPARLIAKNTVAHMEAGIYYGTLSMIEGMVKRYQNELGVSAKVIGTGGLSCVFADSDAFHHHEPHLTLKGLELISRKRFGEM